MKQHISLLFGLVASILPALSWLAPDASAYNTGYYAAHSRLADGKWAKISTDTAGIYEIGYDQLRSWGFTDPSAVHVYGSGALTMTDDTFHPTLTDDIRPTFEIHDGKAGKLFFYSPGVVNVKMTSPAFDGVDVIRTPYTSKAYFLISDRPLDAKDRTPEQIPVANPGLNALDAHYAVELFEEELQNPAEGGAVFLGRNVPVDGEVPFTFDFTNMGGGATDWSNAYMRVNYAGADANTQTKAPIRLNGNLAASEVTATFIPISVIFEDAIVYRHGATLMSWDRPLDGKRTFALTHPASSRPRFLAFDNAWTAFPRLSKMDAGMPSLDMHFPGVSRATNFALDAPSGVRVLNITDQTNIFEHQTAEVPDVAGRLIGSFDRSYSSVTTGESSTCRLIAFNPAVDQKSVGYVGPVANQDLHSLEVPDMLIITTSELRPAAEELVKIHDETDGLNCVIAEAEDIYNEFSGGNPDAMAYRRFAKMLYDRDPGEMSYLLLYGPGHWDNRGIVFDRKGMLMTYQAKDPLHAGNKTRNYTADSFFGMLSDSNHASGIQGTSMTVAVGRIPALNLSTARDVNKKIKNYLSNPRPARLYSRILVLSDDGDQNIHFSQSQQLISTFESLHEPTTAIRVPNVLYPWDGADAKMARELAVESLTDGVGLFTYTGHGHPAAFTGEQMWTRSIVQSSNYDYPPLAFLSTCDPLAFDRDEQGIAETMLFKADGGMSGIVGASRTVYSPFNHELMVRLMTAYGQASSGATQGQIWRIGRNAAISRTGVTNDSRLNTMCYNFCGDPSLPIGAPSLKVKVDKIDEINPSEAETVSLIARHPVKVSGRVTTASGSTSSTFNGRLTITVFDTPLTLKTNPRKPASDPVLTVVLDQNVLASKTIEIYNGQFETELFIPYPTVENDSLTSRMVLVADNYAGTLRGAGALHNLRLSAPGASETTTEYGDPIINDIAIDSYDIGRDGVTITAGTGHALIAEGTTDGTGINASTAIGARPTLVIDPTSATPTSLRLSPEDFMMSDNHWKLTRSLPALAPGCHTARLTIVDNAGKRASSEINFTVLDAPMFTLEAESEHPVVSHLAPLTIDLNSEGPQEIITESKLIVRDLSGNTVKTVVNPTFPLTLEVEDKNLTTGHFEAFVIGKTEKGLFSTPALGITVVKTAVIQ